MLLRAIVETSGDAACGEFVRPALQHLAMAGKGDRWQAVGFEPPYFLHLIARRGLAANQAGAIWQKDDALVVDDDVLDGQRFDRLDLDLHLFAALADQRGFRMLVPIDIATGQPPQTPTWFDVAPTQENAPGILDQRDDDDLGIAKEDPVAVRTRPQGLLRHEPRLSLRSAAGAINDHRARPRLRPAGTTNRSGIQWRASVVVAHAGRTQKS